MAALDDLKAQGYDITTANINDISQITQGLTSGQFQFSAGAANTAMTAAAKGAPIKIIGDRNGVEWAEVAINSIKQCSDLQGKRWAHASQTGTSIGMGHTWLKDTCPGTQPVESIIQNSPDRAAALQAGQIDATELELGDAIRLTTAHADQFHILANFVQTLPNLKPSAIYGNTDFMKQNPGTAVDFLKAVIAENRKVNADQTGGYLKQIVLKYNPKISTTALDTVIKAYLDGKIFEDDGGLTTDNLAYSIKFFTDGGSLDKGLTVQGAADLTFLQLALKSLQ